MGDYLSLFTEEVISQGWLTILRFNGFIIFAYVAGTFIKEFISHVKDRVFEGAPLVVAAIFIGLSVWCGIFLLGCPHDEVKTVAISCFLIGTILGYIAGIPKEK